MPRKSKTPTTERYTFAQSLSELYSDRESINKLRADILATNDKLVKQLVALRNTIPTADNSDGRNAVHDLVERGIQKTFEFEQLFDIITDRKIKEYIAVRKEKKKERAKKQQAEKRRTA